METRAQENALKMNTAIPTTVKSVMSTSVSFSALKMVRMAMYILLAFQYSSLSWKTSITQVDQYYSKTYTFFATLSSLYTQRIVTMMAFVTLTAGSA